MTPQFNNVTIDGNRTVDKFGYLTVENCVLTGEDVAKYFGYEVPNYKNLGLDANKIYDVYRPLEEIKDANFSNKPLLSRHVDFSAIDYKEKFIVGTIGETRIENDKNKGTVAFWKQAAIDELAKGLKYLSCGYMYEPVLENGTHNGKPYQIKMTNIVANHVAMVDNPRYKLAVVADEQLNTTKQTLYMEGKPMPVTTDAGWSFDAAMKELKDYCSTSKDSEEEKEKKFQEMKEKIKEKVGSKDKAKDKAKAKDKEKDDDDEPVEDEELDNKHQEENQKRDGLQNAGDKSKGKDKKMTGDADVIRKLVADSVAIELDKFKKKTIAFDSAIREYERTCGKINRTAFDSAEKVLDTILKNNRVNFDGKSFDQKQAMVEMIPNLSQKSSYSAPIIVGDSSEKNHTPANVIEFLNKRGN